MATLVDWDERLKSACETLQTISDRYMVTCRELAIQLGMATSTVSCMCAGVTSATTSSYQVFKLLHIADRNPQTKNSFDAAVDEFPTETEFRRRIAEKLTEAFHASEYKDKAELGHRLGYTGAAVRSWLGARKTPDICALEDICVGLGVNVMEIWE